jgi:DtxR family manganese transport transcriptional regulator
MVRSPIPVNKGSMQICICLHLSALGAVSMDTKKEHASYILSKVRQARAQPELTTTSVEDYLEVIYELIQEKGYARSIEISKYLRVTSPSVTSMLQRLHRMGFVVYERYRGITLTNKGERLARSVKERHIIIAKLLRILGVNEDIANSDAEGIEHHVHRITIDHITRFVDFVKDNPAWFEIFSRTIPNGPA